MPSSRLDSVESDQKNGTSLSAQTRGRAHCEDEILTVHEIAGRLRVAPSWVYGHARLLGAFRLGKYLRFSWARVLERLDRLKDE
jgi:hypothetical protein